MINRVEDSFLELTKYCEESQYKGWDPYDGLNSRILSKLFGLRNWPLFRLCWIQFFKRCPINLRPLFLIDKGYNSKGLGLFISGYCEQYKMNPDEEIKKKILFLVDELLELQNKNYSGACWGYNFDWQARAFFQPKNTPTVVATSFIVDALIEAYLLFDIKKLHPVISSTADFVLKDLNRITHGDNFGVSYSPLDKVSVFNASLLGAKLLSKVASITDRKDLFVSAKKIVQYCVDHQQDNGSWSYGTEPFHYWIDNFHTAYNLECISEYQRLSGDLTYSGNIESGLKYYTENFFLRSGMPKYYNNSTYPIDIHAPAELIVMMVKLEKFSEHRDLIDRTLNWTLDHMRSKEGYFYYQKKKLFNSKIPYMRWSQAWMFYALSFYLKGARNVQ